MTPDEELAYLRQQWDKHLARILELEDFIERLAEKILAAHEVLANRAEKNSLPARAGNEAPPE